jgi:hypothetical protein
LPATAGTVTVTGAAVGVSVVDSSGPGVTVGDRVPPRTRLRWLVVTLVMHSACTLLSIAAPSLGDLINVLGSSLGILTTFSFPAVFSLRLMYNKLSVRWRAIHLGVLAASSGFLFVSTYTSVHTFVEHITENANPFSCG